MNDEFGEFNVDCMKRLEQKGELIADITNVFQGISQNLQVYSKCGYYGFLFRRKAVKSVFKDFKKGLRVIEKKIPVYVELPKLEEKSNGGYVEHRANDPPGKTDEIVFDNIDMLPDGRNDGTT